MESDFAQLYAWLDLRPDCTLDEFKRAYRRRVAELHPDRHPDAGSGAPAPMRLSELTSLYGTATRFHRQHGRLPGADPRTRQGMEASLASAESTVRPLVVATRPDVTVNGTPIHQRTLLAALVVIVILVLMVVLESSQPSPDWQPDALREHDLREHGLREHRDMEYPEAERIDAEHTDTLPSEPPVEETGLDS